MNNLTIENFTDRLKQTNLQTKANVADFIDTAYFKENLTNINTKVNSNKTKTLNAEKKLKDHITSHTKLKDDLSIDVSKNK